MVYMYRARRVTLLAMIIKQFQFNQIFGLTLPTIKDEIIDLRLREVDLEEGISLFKTMND